MFGLGPLNIICQVSCRVVGRGLGWKKIILKKKPEEKNKTMKQI